MIRKPGLGFWLAVALALGGALLFYSGMDSPFIFDDVAKIRDNADLHLRDFSIHDFIHDYSDKKTHHRNDPSRPLTYMIYWVLWQIGDGETTPFHVAGVFLHALSALLVGLLAHRLLQKTKGIDSPLAAILASFLYLSLPVNAGTVIYSYGLSDVLGAFFSLLLICHLLRKEKLNAADYLIATVIYACGVFSKQSALVVPGIWLAIDFTLGSFASIKARWKMHLMLFAEAGLYVLWRYLFFGRIGDLEAYDTYQVPIYGPLQGIMIWKYFAWIFVPWHLAIDHAVTPSQFEYWQCYLSWGSISVISILCVIFARKSSTLQIVSVGWFLFLFGLLPTSSLFPTTDLLVERREYFSSAGVLLSLAALIALALKNGFFKNWKKLSLATAVGLFMAMNFYLCVQRVLIYDNEEALWKEVIELYPRNERPRVNLATYYLKLEDFERAEKELSELLAMYPNYYEALVNQAALYQHPKNPRRNLQKALEYNERALVQEPEDLTALMNRGILMLDLNRPQEAIAYFQKMLSLTSNNVKARLALAESYFRTGQNQKAREEAQKVLQLEPQNYRAQTMLNR